VFQNGLCTRCIDRFEYINTNGSKKKCEKCPLDKAKCRNGKMTTKAGFWRNETVSNQIY
jgi:hypothetical protein